MKELKTVANSEWQINYSVLVIPFSCCYYLEFDTVHSYLTMSISVHAFHETYP